jgi:glycosyltransferase involved in cell wall biosynthesis
MSRARSDERSTLRVVLYTDSPVIGGGENFARDLLAKLHPPFEPVVAGPRADVIAHIASGHPGMETRVLPPVRGRSSFVSLREHARVLRQLDPDVVHVNQHLWSGQYGVLASALAGLPSVCVVHGAMPPASSSQRYLTIATARLARHFVGVSHFITAQILAEMHLDGRRVSTIYNGIPSEEPEASRRAQTQPGTILGVGRLAREKGFDLLVEAMPHLPGRRLVLAGDGPERASLEALAKRLGVEARVDFAGWVSEPWANRFRPDLMAVPSRFEAMPLVVLEAMRAGVPVVATRVGGTPELVVDNVTGLLVEPESPMSLAESIEGLLVNPQRREEMALAAKSRLSERFSDSTMIASYEALYAAISGHTTPQSASGAGALFGPAQAQRNERLRGFAQIMPPETRQRVKKVALTGKKAFKIRSLTTSSPLRPLAAGPTSEFVLQHLDAVRGSVLVLGEPKLGEVARASSQRIDKCVVCDLDPRNLQASLLADPLEEGSLGSGEYDCELVVGAAWQRSDCRLVIANLWQALRPGGSLLFVVPAAGTDRDGFTEAELRVLVEACSPTARAEIVSMKGDLADGHQAIASREPEQWLAGIVERAGEETA